MNEVRFTLLASRQRDNIASYLDKVLMNPGARSLFLNSLMQKVELLELNGNVGEDLQASLPNLSRAYVGTRKLVFNGYVLFFVEKPVGIVTISHIFHELQNYGKAFESNE